MPNFFSGFPTIDYDIFKNGTTIKCVNTTKRFAPLKSVMNNVTLYYPYKIRAGQRPDIVSDLMYGTVDYDWIILMFNMVLDPYYQWPMFYDEFNAYLDDKYGSWQASTQLIREYRIITVPYEKLFDGTVIEEQSLVIDQDYYLTLPDFQRKVVYAYDWEVEQNDKKRNIQIVDKVYLPQILAEKERVFNASLSNTFKLI